MNYRQNSNYTSLFNRRNEYFANFSSLLHHLYIHSGSVLNQTLYTKLLSDTKMNISYFLLY